MNSIVTSPSYQRSAEVSFAEIFEGLWGQKKFIFSCAAVFLLFAALYAFLATPRYEVRSVLRPTQFKDLDGINGTGVYKISPEEALKRVGASLDSYDTRIRFFNANRQLFEPLSRTKDMRDIFEEFNSESLTLIQPDPKGANLVPFVGLSMEYPANIDGVAILNGLVRQAVKDEKQRIVQDLEGIIKSRINVISRQLSAARAKYETEKDSKIAILQEQDQLKKIELLDELKALRIELRLRRQARISQLDEAINIAKSLGIVKPTSPTALGQGESAVQGNVFRTEVFNQQFPLYFMGTEALTAERTTLRNRSSDDHVEPRIARIQNELKLLEINREVELLKKRQNEDRFLEQVAALREKTAKLEGIKIDLDGLELVRVDQPAANPTKPIKPNKWLIMVLGLFIGIFVGVALAFCKQFIFRSRS